MQKDHLKKLPPAPDATHSMHLLADEVGGTVENSVIRGESVFLSESHPSLSLYAPPPSTKSEKMDYPDDMP